MADTFPTALQRISDERWVTLDVIAREDARVIARIAEASDQVAVVRLGDDPGHDPHLRRLLATPPPDAGRDIRMAWPLDLLHDMDARVVGYTVRRTASAGTFALADFVDPARRAEIAPMSTRRHLLRVARNVATATAALHHAGHAHIHDANLRVNDRAQVLVVRVDELRSDATDVMRAEDERRLGVTVHRLLSGKPWATAGRLGELLGLTESPGTDPVPAQDWVFALRDAERALPRTPSVAPTDTSDGTPHGQGAGASWPATSAAPSSATSMAPSTGTSPRSAATTDLATALRESRAGGAAPTVDTVAMGEGRPADRVEDPPSRSGTNRPAEPVDLMVAETDRSEVERPQPELSGRAEPEPQPDEAVDLLPAELTTLDVVPTESAPTVVIDLRPAADATTPEPTLRLPVPADSGAIPRSERQRRARSDGRHMAVSATAEPLPPAGPARWLFALAAGLSFGIAASVAPFAAFLVVACAMILNAAVNVGRVKGTRGPQQQLAIIVSRLVPFATGGLALAAFILLDLLLLLGLCMALGERLFNYGPGFTLTWVLQLPEVPGLVRVFAFCVGAFGGMGLGGATYDRIRTSPSGRRMIVTPAVAVALAAGILLADAQVVWWPLPLVA